MTLKAMNKFWKIQAKAKEEIDILLYGVVGNDDYWDDVTAKKFAEELAENKDAKTINVRINSPGGSVFAGQSIYSMLRREANAGKTINVYIDGLAASIASVIAMAGDTVYMPKNAMMMIHDPWSLVIGNSDEMRKEADVLDKIGESLIAVYKDKAGIEEEEIKNIMSAETWFTAQEAVDKGFADVLEDRKVEACLKNDEVIVLNGQDIDISKFGNFDTSRFPKAKEPSKQPKPEAKAQAKFQTSNPDKKAKEKTMLKELCAKLGVNYDAMIADGKTEEDIQAYCLKKMDDKYKEASAAEQTRMKAILTLGKTYAQNELALEYVQEGKTLDEFKDALIKAQAKKDDEPTKTNRTIQAVGLNAQEAQQFSILRLARAMADPGNKKLREEAAFEFDACAAAADVYGEGKNGGNRIPIEVLRTPMAATGDIDTTLGGTLIPEDTRISSFIELLRNKSVVMQLATQINNLVGTVNIPNQTAGMTGYWVGEDTAPTLSEPTLSEVSLAMKTVGARCRLTRSMKKQTTMDMEAFLRRELATTLALQIDLKAFYGTGSSNQPTGIKLADGINTKEFATQYQPTYSEIVGMETEVAADNADVGSMAYIFDANMRGHLKTTEKFADSNGAPIWEPGNTVNGYKTFVTNQITKGDVFFGNFSDLLIGMWGGLELLVDPYGESTQGATRLTAFQDIDIALRHAASFCFGSDDLSGTTGTTA